MTLHNAVARALAVLALFIVVVPLGHTQVDTGNILGTVSDASGAAIPGA